MKKFIIILFLIPQLSFAAQRDSVFEQIGDVLALMPIFVGVASLSIEDYWGLGQLALGTALAQGSIELIKHSLQSAHNKGKSLDFAKRPCCDDYKGMPSGHSGGGFSAAAFVYYRYGWKPAIPVITLAFVTAASRVYARKHTIWQVMGGGAIAWAWGFLVTTKFKPKNLTLTPVIGADSLGGALYSAQISYRF